MPSTRIDPYEVITDVSDLRAARKRLADYRANIARPALGSADREAAEVIAASAVTGNIPDAEVITAELAKQRARTQEHTALQAALTEADRLLESRERAAIIDGADDGLRYLSGVLDEITTELRPVVDKLGDVSSADDAVATRDPDVVTAWNKLGDLSAAYRELRAHQRDLVRVVGPTANRGHIEWPRILDVVGIIRNADEIHPEWNDVDKPPPWPNEVSSFLLWSVRTNDPAVELWVPTITRLLDAFAEADTAAGSRRREAHDLELYGRVRTPEERAADHRRASVKIKAR